MKLIKNVRKTDAKVSLVLIDWSVRESFHILDYLRQQTAARDDFEVIVVEYYSKVSNAVRMFEDQVDTWLLLEMPDECYYHKHLMYNAGIAMARGEIICICDSDAMVRETFVESIVREFEADPNIVLHLDQFRNVRRDFYPFNNPSFAEVLGEGCINLQDHKTTGLCDKSDLLHSRNYGSTMCARREDMIAIGGADEHQDFLGYICGPYDMTFRLVNHGKREVWSETEFTYHTWHPGQAGEGNMLGPHDGLHMSTTALFALIDRRVRPLCENEVIKKLRLGASFSEVDHDWLIRKEARDFWSKESFSRSSREVLAIETPACIDIYRGVQIIQEGKFFRPVWWADMTYTRGRDCFADTREARKAVSKAFPISVRLKMHAYSMLSYGSRTAIFYYRGLCKLWRSPGRVIHNAKAYADRAVRVAMEQGHFSEEMEGILALLCQKEGQSTSVLMMSRVDMVVLDLMMKCRMLPRAHLFLIRNIDDIVQSLDEIPDGEGRLLMQRSLFYRFHEKLRELSVAKNVVVS